MSNAPSSSEAFPPALWSVVKAQMSQLAHEGRTRSIAVEYWIPQGRPVKATVRSGESIFEVDLRSDSA